MTSAPLWDPMPRDLAADLACYTWTPAAPAPEIVAYAWTWRQARDGAAPSIRDIADYAGRGKTWAQRVRQRVLDDLASWGTGAGLAVPNGTAPGQSRDSRGTHDAPVDDVVAAERDSTGTVAGQSRDTSRARASLGQDRDKDRIDPSTVEGIDPSSSLRPDTDGADQDPQQPTLALVVDLHPAAPVAPPAPKVDKAADLWAELQAIRREYQPRAGGQVLTTERRATLVSRSKAIAQAGMGREDLVRAVRWVFTSENIHAEGARKTGDPLAVLLRHKHCVKYVELARDEALGAHEPAEQPQHKPKEDPAAAAWDKVQQQLQAHGRNALERAPQQVLHAVDALGGVGRLAGMTAFELGRLWPAFRDAYHRGAA